MTDPHVNDLLGRLDGLARAYLLMARSLQQADLLDRQQLQALLRNHAEQLTDQQATTAHYLEALADELLHMSLMDAGRSRDDLTEIRNLWAERAAAAHPDRS